MAVADIIDLGVDCLPGGTFTFSPKEELVVTIISKLFKTLGRLTTFKTLGRLTTFKTSNR